jgi:hypothetical protein
VQFNRGLLIALVIAVVGLSISLTLLATRPKLQPQPLNLPKIEPITPLTKEKACRTLENSCNINNDVNACVGWLTHCQPK